jgi:PAS domain S-box-containing protein
VLALYLLLIVPFLIALLLFNQWIGVQIRQSAKANDLALARAIAQETNNQIANALESVQKLATYPAVIQADSAGMEQLFGVVMSSRPDVNLVYRLSKDGVMLFHFPTAPGSTVGTDFSFREYYRRALTSEGPLVSEGRISPTTNQAVATAVMPIHSPEGTFLGLVGANIRLESLSQTLAAIVAERNSLGTLQVVILDSSDQIIAFADPALLLHNADDVLPAGFLGGADTNTSSQVLMGPDRTERLYTRAGIPDIGWTVVVGRPTAAAFATLTILQRITAIAAIAFLLIGVFFWAMLSLRVIKPIEQLAPISEAIGTNQTLSAEDRHRLVGLSRRTDQIGHLIKNILRMERSIAERIRGQDILLETSAAVVSSLDLKTVLDRVLEQMARLLEVNRCAIIALDEKRGAFRVQAGRGLSERYMERLSIQPSEPESVTMRALRAREVVYISDTETDPSYVNRRNLSRSEGYRAIMAVPLNTQHAPPTALLVFHDAPHNFSPNEIRLLSAFANHAAMAIENAVLFERSDARLEKQTRRLEALIQSMEDGLILSDPNGQVVYFNRSVEALVSMRPEELSGSAVADVLSNLVQLAADPASAGQEVARVLAGSRFGGAEIELRRGQGPIHLRLESFDVTDIRGKLTGHGLILHDVTVYRELDRMKSNLISTVSHELRTPLAAIKGYASTLLAEDVQWDRSAEKEFLKVISDETDRLGALVSNLLDLSRIEAGSLQIGLEECDVNQLVLNAARQARLPDTVSFDARIPVGMPALLGDPARLETVLRNLIENAIKYGGPGANIQVEVSLRDGYSEFRVSDDGPGIPVEQRERIFESFYRVENGLTRTASGAGLGLAICEGFVRAHGGRIWVESREVGTCIAFELPQVQTTKGRSLLRESNSRTGRG